METHAYQTFISRKQKKKLIQGVNASKDHLILLLREDGPDTSFKAPPIVSLRKSDRFQKLRKNLKYRLFGEVKRSLTIQVAYELN